MRIALLQPPVEDFYQTSIRTQPVGLLYLAAVLEAAGHTVRLFDFLSSHSKKAIPLPADFLYLKPHFNLNDCSPIRAFKHYYHYGLSWRAVEAALQAEECDIYAITCMFTPFQSQARRLAALIRSRFPDRMIVAGGTHATSSPEEVLGGGLFDRVFQGEGEVSFPRWLASPDGRQTRRESSGVENRVIAGETIDDLDAIPFPARHLIDLDRYRIDGVRSTMLITSRGCPYHCTFCSVQQTMGHPFRTRSTENVLREIEECVEQYDIRHFDVEDDNFTFDQRRAEQLMTAVLDRFGEHKLRFSAMNGLTATSLDPPLLRRMRQAGFRQVNLSLVASQPGTLRELKRPVSLSGFRRTVRSAREAGLDCTAYFILGLPGDDARRMLETLLALAAEPVLAGPSVFYVSPGTELFDALLSHVPENWDLLRSSSFFMEGGTSTRLQRITLFRLTRLINFLKDRIDAAVENRRWPDRGLKNADRESQPAAGVFDDAGLPPGSWHRACLLPPGIPELLESAGASTPVTFDLSSLIRDSRSIVCDPEPPASDARLSSSLETRDLLGWAVVCLLGLTGLFHAARRKPGARLAYVMEPVPTCAETVQLFLEMSRSVPLRGVRTGAAVPLADMLDTAPSIERPGGGWRDFPVDGSVRPAREG